MRRHSDNGRSGLNLTYGFKSVLNFAETPAPYGEYKEVKTTDLQVRTQTAPKADQVLAAADTEGNVKWTDAGGGLGTVTGGGIFPSFSGYESSPDTESTDLGDDWDVIWIMNSGWAGGGYLYKTSTGVQAALAIIGGSTYAGVIDGINYKGVSCDGCMSGISLYLKFKYAKDASGNYHLYGRLLNANATYLKLKFS